MYVFSDVLIPNPLYVSQKNTNRPLVKLFNLFAVEKIVNAPAAKIEWIIFNISLEIGYPDDISLDFIPYSFLISDFMKQLLISYSS